MDATGPANPARDDEDTLCGVRSLFFEATVRIL
jgi:hypothetical protein